MYTKTRSRGSRHCGACGTQIPLHYGKLISKSTGSETPFYTERLLLHVNVISEFYWNTVIYYLAPGNATQFMYYLYVTEEPLSPFMIIVSMAILTNQ